MASHCRSQARPQLVPQLRLVACYFDVLASRHSIAAVPAAATDAVSSASSLMQFPFPSQRRTTSRIVPASQLASVEARNTTCSCASLPSHIHSDAPSPISTRPIIFHVVVGGSFPRKCFGREIPIPKNRQTLGLSFE